MTEPDGPDASGYNDDFAQSVRDGLTSQPKSLPCRFLYDALGGRLFQAICELPEYYLTRAEREILKKRGGEIAAALPHGTALVELGSGNSDKSRTLLEALIAGSGCRRFVPIDISEPTLTECAQQLSARYPELHVTPICDEYRGALAKLNAEAGHPVSIAWLGSSIGNLARSEAIEFLHQVKGHMIDSDRLLVGIDLQKDRRVLERAYDDPLGVTAAFNLNLLARINRQLAANFDLANFRHSVRYDEAAGRIEMHIISLCNQTVSIRELGLDIAFERNEPIHTENCYKYTPAQITDLAHQTGFELDRQWLDHAGRFSLNLFRPK